LILAALPAILMRSPSHVSRPSVLSIYCRLGIQRNWLSQGLAPIALSFALVGCGGAGRSGPGAANVDAEDAATQTIAKYDLDKDGAIDAQELAAYRPLSQIVLSYDENGDAEVSPAELAARFKKMFESGANVTGFDCTVTLDGRPLSGATVRLRPAEILGDALPPAEGTTNAAGVARLSVAPEVLPEDLRSAQLIYPGLYQVEVTHPQANLPSRYNTSTELGVEVDPASRTGTFANFNLKSN